MSGAIGETPQASSPMPANWASSAAASELLCATLTEVVKAFKAAMGAVYLAEPGGDGLRAAMIAGTPPAIFALPERVAFPSTYSSARAFLTAEVAVIDRPQPSLHDHSYAGLFPYSVVSAPVVTAGHRFGALTLLTYSPTGGPAAERNHWLRNRAARLAEELAPLVEEGAILAPETSPVLIPLFHAQAPAAATEGTNWGLPCAPGSAGTTMMYQVRKLADALNRALSADDVFRAAQLYLMVPFGGCEIILSALEDGRLWVVGYSGAPPETARHIHGSAATGGTPAADALHGRPLFFRDHRARQTTYPGEPDADRAWAYLPLRGSNARVGVCSLGFEEPRAFAADEQATLMMMADQVGTALERVRLSESEHACADRLHARLLPRVLSELPEVSVVARYLHATPGAGTGGDWYDVLPLPNDRIVLVIGDVEGHSVESSIVMGEVRTAVLAYASEGLGPSAIMGHVGKLLSELDTNLLATCCIAILDADSATARLCLAGHPPPVVRGPNGRTSTVDIRPGPPLGIWPPPVYEYGDAEIEPGSLLLLYTNGLAEGWNSDVVSGARHLLASLGESADHGLESCADTLVAALPDRDRRDDAAFLLARYEGAGLTSHGRINRMEIQRRDLRDVRAARKFVRNTLMDWDLNAISDDLELIVTELATNALVHADSDVELRMREGSDHIRLEVKDADPTPPVPALVCAIPEENEQAEHGRGLLIVDALTSAFGTSPSGRGKTVWLEVPTGLPARW
ncbi:SpoIIE family protein phosphatase [Streptomyces sp. NPDC058232]|uniref:ATP-binding SpoIIE family protein phosphatase n=1 Tax=Streptomyces sp. NPDC058232 TaxID=3346393 RepID=UPI0036E58131